jgi:hypothetical protein
MLCFSCNKPKQELQPAKSNLLSGVQLFLCQSCIDLKFEPRWVIILAGRQKGADHVRDYIVKNLYVGNKISAEEIIA